MLRNRAYGDIVVGIAFALSSVACASKMSASGDETHFQMCNVTGDCKNLGEAYSCRSGLCRTGPDSGVRGSGGATSVSGALTAFCSALNASSGDLDGGVVQRLLGAAASACTIRASDYDRSCTEDMDCAAVGEGNACETPCEVACPNTAIRNSAMDKYNQDYDNTPASMCGPSFCGCPALGNPRCVNGTCALVPIQFGTPDAGESAFCSEYVKSDGNLTDADLQRLLGADAAKCTIQASDYDRSCAKDTDCTGVPEGNACEPSCAFGCANSPISVSALAKYMDDFGNTPVSMCPSLANPKHCNCPAELAPRCIDGTCEKGGPGAPDAGDGGNP